MRSCLECYKFHYADGAQTYSEVTVGWAAEMSCDAVPAHWRLDLSGGCGHTEAEVRQVLLSAETCPDFISPVTIRAQHEEEQVALRALRQSHIIKINRK